jgi:hypothetical protein
MYTIQVFQAGSLLPVESHHVKVASEVLKRIPELLKEHRGCERLVVLFGATTLFAVDCKGNSLPS